MAVLSASVVTPRAMAEQSPLPSKDDYYAKLGVKPIINAAGSYTFLTAAVMPPQVQRAVAMAAMHPVRLKDLQHAAGEYLAKALHCEAALVSSGASASLTLATAACLASANGFAPQDIPSKVPFGKNEIIVQRSHRYEYDHAMLLCGAQIREVRSLEEYKRAFNAKTVMTNYFNSAEEQGIDRETWLKIAHEHGVPCHNDAAADIPPVSNLWRYTEMGFDLVSFSGGKGIRGPQNAGLLLGKKQLIEIAVTNNNPNSEAIGRGMKVAKEQIVGMVAAIDWLLEQSDEKDQIEYRRRTDVILHAVKDIPTLQATIVVPAIANHVPHLVLTYDPEVVGISPGKIQELLRKGTPPIELNPATGTASRGLSVVPNSIVLSTWMMLPGEEQIVAQRLRTALLEKR